MSLFSKLKALRVLLYREQRNQERLLELKKRNPDVRFMEGAFADSDCSFQGLVVLTSNVRLSKCSIGKYTYIAHDSRLSRCNVGSYCSIGPELLAGLGIHPSHSFVSTHPSFYAPQNTSSISYVSEQKFSEFEQIKIGNDVWIGARVTITDGVNIGDGAIIAAGAVVVKDVEPYSIVGSVPAKEIRKRFNKEEIEFLLKYRWWDKEDEWIQKNAHLFSNIQDFMSKFEN